MEKEELRAKYNYISLNEASQLCRYSQRYLNLRARQGKFKAIKIGRNWATKKEWVEDYIRKIEEYKNNLKYKKAVKEEISGSVKSAPRMALGVMLPLVFCLLIAGGVFGKTSFQNVYEDMFPYVFSVRDFAVNTVKEIQVGVSNGVDPVRGFVANTITQTPVAISNGVEETNEAKELVIENIVAGLSDIVQGSIDGFEMVSGDLSPYLFFDFGDSAFDASKKITFGIFDKIQEIDEIGSLLINNAVQGLAVVSQDLNFGGNISEILSQDLKQDWQTLTKPLNTFYYSITSPEKVSAPERVSVPEQDQKTQKEISSLRQELDLSQEKIRYLLDEINKIKEEGLPVKEIVKEVSKITKIEPIKEITKETTVFKLDDDSLKEVRAQITNLQSEIGDRLYAPGGTITQQIYVSEPVSSSKIYQENGDIIFQTIGSGNVIVSAATGLQLSGQQITLNSTSQISPLVYIADKTRIGGALTVDGEIEILEGGTSSTYYTILKGGDQSATITYTLPTADGTSGQALLTDGAGVLTWGDVVSGGSALPTGTLGQTLYHNGTDWAVSSLLYNNGTAIGIATTGPDRKLDILDASNPQLRLTHTDGSVYGDFQIDSSGDLTLITTGNEIFIDDHLKYTTDNTYDIGASGVNRPRTVYAATSFVAGNTTTFGDNSIAFSGAATIDLAGSQTSALNIESGLLNIDTSNFRIGIGTTSPLAKLTVAGNMSIGSSYATATVPTDGLIVQGNVGFGITTPPAKLSIQTSGTTDILNLFETDGAQVLTVLESGSVGIGTTGPDRKLDILDTSNPQLRLSQNDGSVYSEFQAKATTGDLELTLSGDNFILLNDNLQVCALGACPDVGLSGTGDLVVENDVYFDGSKINYPSALGTPKRSIILTSAGAIAPTTGGANQTKVDGTNHTYYVLDFDAASDEAAYWHWTMLDSYNNGTIDITYYWEATATSGDVVWCFQAAGVAANSTEDIDPSLSTAVCETDTAQGNANDLASATESSTASNFSAGEYVVFKVFRDADNAADTMTGDARLVKVKIEYSVSKESD